MKKQVFVGGTLQDASHRVADAWHRAERGEHVEPQDNVTVMSWEALSSVMTQKRYEILLHLHRQPANSIRALSRDIGRDFKRVHEDVTALESIGLIERKARKLHADYDVINTSIFMNVSAA